MIEKPTLDQQIEYITIERISEHFKDSDTDEAMCLAIKENLIAIKRWNQNPLWSQMDVEKVIEDLVADLRLVSGMDCKATASVQNAEAALGMLQAFKEKRDTPVKHEAKYPYKIDEVGLTAQMPVENKISSKIIYEELNYHKTVFDFFREDDDEIINIQEVYKLMASCLESGNKIISFGNGGSMSDAMHFASELVGRYRGTRDAIAAIALSDPAALTCIGNDFGYNQVFKRQLQAVGKDGDVVLALSTSGNSENVLVAAEYAKRMGIKVVSICGNGGGQLKQYCDVMIEVPHSGYAARIQEMTILVIHILVQLIEESQCEK